jgi:hypothetical protein
MEFVIHNKEFFIHGRPPPMGLLLVPAIFSLHMVLRYLGKESVARNIIKNAVLHASIQSACFHLSKVCRLAQKWAGGNTFRSPT